MFRKIMYHTVKISSCFALLLAISNVNVACSGIIHQPEIPEELMKYKR